MDVQLQQVAQRVIDLDRATTFYAGLLGLPPAARFDPPGLVFFNLGSVRLLLDRAAPGCLLYLRVDDLHARIEELRAEGVEIVQEPHVIFTHTDDRIGPAGNDEWQAFIRDSEENIVGLIGYQQMAP